MYGPDLRDTLIETLQRELELRNREVARLHDVIGQQAAAIERAASAPPTGPNVAASPASPADPPARRGFWAWLLGRES